MGKMTRDELEIYILDMYTEYQIYMNTDEMPELNIAFGDASCGAIMCIYTSELYDKNIVLHTNYGITEDCQDSAHYNATLFHEFTHIYDGMKILSLFPNISYNRFVNILSQYSESHAHYVQICVEAKYENINDFKIIRETDIVNINLKAKSLKEHFLDSLRTAIDISNEDEMNYNRYKIEVSYFWGTAMFCEKHLGYKVNFEQFPKKYRKEYCEWYNAVLKNNIKNFYNKNFDLYIANK